MAAGFYFANPRNRFWRALAASGLADVPDPGPAAHRRLLEARRLGFTDVVKRPTPGAGALRAADFRRWAPVLEERIRRYQPRVVWFHGRVAYRGYLRYAPGRRPSDAGQRWGLQPEGIDRSAVFVSPNPSPANAQFSLADLIAWYAQIGALRDAGARR